MAQSTNYTPISLYYSSTATNVPSSGNLVNGELALNIADMKLYAKNSSGVVTLLASNTGATATVSSVAVSGGTTGLTTSGGPITTSGTITFAGTLIAANGGTGFASYTTGDMLYASGATTISKLALGTTNYVLTAGASGPQYVAQSTLAAGSATTATNLAGGTANQIPYQTGAGATSFVTAPSTAGYVLGWTGSAFSWVNAPAATSATTLTGGGAYTVVYQSSAGTTAYLTNGTTGQVLTANTGAAPTWTTASSNAYTRTTYTATSGQTSFAVTYTAGYVQVYLNGVMLTASDYTATNGTTVVLTVGATLNDIVEFIAFNTTAISNTTANNLLAGTAGQVVYQSAPNTTAFTGPGTTGQALISNASSGPTFGTLGIAGGGTGTTSTQFANLTTNVTGTLPIANGGTNSTATPTAGGVGYGTGTAHAYTAVGTTGQALVSAGAGAPAFGTLGVAGGGTGAVTLTGVLKGNGTGALTAATAGTDYVAPGTATTFTALQTFSGSISVLAMAMANAGEVATVSATAATGTINYDVTTQSVLYYTTSASANWTVNIRANGTNTLNSIMAVGQSVTVAFLVTQGATAYYNSALTIDGTSVTPKYQGGTAWSAGNASGIDSYVYTIIKTASATFTVLASQTQFK